MAEILGFHRFGKNLAPKKVVMKTISFEEEDVRKPIPVPENWKDLASHPIASVFPLMEGDALQEFTESIRAKGYDLEHPIVIYEGEILDGRNRRNACAILSDDGALSEDPPFVEWIGPGSPIDWVLQENLHRRHLSDHQRTFVAAGVLPLYEEEAKKRQQEAGKSSAPGRPAEKGEAKSPQVSDQSGRAPQARDHVATLLNVSPRNVSEAKRLKRDAPDLAEQVEKGQLGLWKASGQLDQRQKSDQASVDNPQLAPAIAKAVGATTPRKTTKNCGIEISANTDPYSLIAQVAGGLIPICQTSRYTSGMTRKAGDHLRTVTLPAKPSEAAIKIAFHFDEDSMREFLLALGGYLTPKVKQFISDRYSKSL